MSEAQISISVAYFLVVAPWFLGGVLFATLCFFVGVSAGRK